MNLIAIIGQLMSLFLMMFAGYVAAKAKVITPEFRKQLSTFTLSIASPSVILSSALESSIPGSSMLLGLIIATVFYAAMSLLAIPLSRAVSAGAQERKLDQLMLIFTNIGFMGIPVSQTLYGVDGVAIVSMFILIFNLVFFSYGMVLMSGKNTFNLRSLRNPCIFAALGALFCVLVGLDLPAPIAGTLSTLGSMNTPLAMVIVGASLAHSNLKATLTNIRLYKLSLMRMVVMPLIVLALVRVLPLSPMLAGITVIMAAMPVASNCAMVSDMYGIEDMTASQAVILTTLISAATTPVICALISVIL